MTRLTWYRLLGVLILMLLALPIPATGAARPLVPASWAQAWPMVGHDPQQTSRSLGTGPLNPHLQWTYRGLFGPETVGPDGSVYGWGNKGLVALTPAGQLRWTAPAQEFMGGPPALGPDGLLRVLGNLPEVPVTTTPSAEQPHMAIFAVSPQGKRVWTIRSLPWATVPESVPFSKGLAPLVTAANVLYMPFVGPVYRPGQNDGVEAVSPGGMPLRRLLASFGGPIAVATDGTVYQLGNDSQGHTALRASTPDGVLLWSHDTTYIQYGSVLAGQNGTIYISDGSNAGASNAAEVAAYTPAGQLLWRVATDGGVANLAERGDGVILVGDATGLTAVSTSGTRLWHRALGNPPATGTAPPSLAVDAAGHAYAGSADGMVRAVSPSGSVLWKLPAGGPVPYSIPTLALGPNGTLEVTGIDSVVRMYR